MKFPIASLPQAGGSKSSLAPEVAKKKPEPVEVPTVLTAVQAEAILDRIWCAWLGDVRNVMRASDPCIPAKSGVVCAHKFVDPDQFMKTPDTWHKPRSPVVSPADRQGFEPFGYTERN